MRHHALLSLTVICTVAATQSSAQDFYRAGVSADTSRRGGIFSATGGNPTDALGLNPAGLTVLFALQ